MAGASTAALFALAGGRALAGAWSAAGDANLSTAYDNNVHFTPGKPVADGTYSMEGDMRLEWTGESSLLSFVPRARRTIYRETSAFDRTEGFLAVTGRKTTERGKVDLKVDGALDTTVTSELGFTGYTDANKRRRALDVSFAPQYRLTERLAMTGNIAASFNRYQDAQFTPLVDYDYRSGSVGLQRTLDERSTLMLQASGGRLRVPGRPQYGKDNYQLVLDYSHQFGPLWSIELAAGPSRVRNPELHRTNSGVVYTASLERGGERSSVDLNATRTVSPNGLGALARRDAVTLHFTRHATERLLVGADGTWARVVDSTLGGGFANSRLRYLDMAIHGALKPSPTLTLQLTVHRYLQSSGLFASIAGKTQAVLGFSWNGLQNVSD